MCSCNIFACVASSSPHGTGVGKTIVVLRVSLGVEKTQNRCWRYEALATANRVFSKTYRSQDTALLARASEANDHDYDLNPFTQ